MRYPCRILGENVSNTFFLFFIDFYRSLHIIIFWITISTPFCRFNNTMWTRHNQRSAINSLGLISTFFFILNCQSFASIVLWIFIEMFQDKYNFVDRETASPNIDSSSKRQNRRDIFSRNHKIWWTKLFMNCQMQAEYLPSVMTKITKCCLIHF